MIFIGSSAGAVSITAFNQVYTADGYLKALCLFRLVHLPILSSELRMHVREWCRAKPAGMVNELLIQNQTNLEAAYGRIMDADMALESTRFARQNVLVQSSAAMVAQANQLTNIALTLLG